MALIKEVIPINNTQYVPYTKEVNINIPTQTEQLVQLHSLEQDIRKSLIKHEIINLQGLNTEVITTIWRDNCAIQNLIRVDLKVNNIHYSKEIPFYSNNENQLIDECITKAVKEFIEGELTEQLARAVKQAEFNRTLNH